MKYIKKEDVKKQIDCNYEFLKSIESYLLREMSDEQRLELISLIGEMYSCLVTGVYSSNFLENELVKIGNRIEYVPERTPKKNNILFIMSEATNTGGHSVIVNNWMRWDKQNSYSIVFTKQNYQDVPEFLKQSVIESKGKILSLQGNCLCKAKELLYISQDYERVILMTHMEDIVPVLAYCNPNWKIPVYLYNHADFRFSFGYSVSDLVINMNIYDKEKTDIYRGVKNSAILQFPGVGNIDTSSLEFNGKFSRDELSKKYGFNKDSKLVVSMGANFKYESIIGVEFDAFAERLVQEAEDNVQFLIIGASPEQEKWIELQKRTNGKARAIGIIKREEATQLIAVADLYIVSFPMGSAGATIADFYDVPYLMLQLIPRMEEFFRESAAKSVDELLSKSIEILKGDVDKYRGNIQKLVLDKQSWCEELYQIYKDNDCHMVREIATKRCIEDREIINCQIMQEEGIRSIRQYINGNLLELISSDLIDKIFEYLYSMGILQEGKVSKVEQKMEIYVFLKKEIQCNKKNFVILPMGYWGKIGKEFLSKLGITPVYCIDNKVYDMKTVFPIKQMPPVPSNTTYLLLTEKKELKQELLNKMEAHMECSKVIDVFEEINNRR